MLTIVASKTEVFTHEDNSDGTIRHFNVTGMFDWAIKNLDECQCGKMPLDESIYNHVMTNRGIEEPRVAGLDELAKQLPILCVEMKDGTTLTVDGHHRIVRNWRDGVNEVLAVRVPLGKWERFLLSDPHDPFKLGEEVQKHAQ